MIRIIILLLFTSPYLMHGNLKAEEVVSPTPSESPSKTKEKKENITFSELFREHQNEAYIGVLLANFISIDPEYRFAYVKPHEGSLPRMTVYLDKKTIYSTMKAGKLGKGKKAMMLEGDRVALRVFVKNGIILADEVFLVEGDFGPKARFAKRKYTSAAGAGPGGAAKAGEKKKSGGGGH